ncbi:putative transcriptional activator srcap homolog [Olavius algarvensis Delta 1 endosymbiont]|nr:putative transcriptional activator srcap homolog [Olavius algarvensis Delta 1 endosymbiont]
MKSDVQLKDASNNLIRDENGKVKTTVQYDGMALIKAADFTITGFGSYAVIGNDPSLFIFAVLHKDLGGPAFFHVTGFAAGFGYNRALKLPPIEEVEHFPLVRGALEENYFDGSGPDQSIVGAMEKLRDYVPPSLGDYWFAVGVCFTSFEMIKSFALLSVSFGHEVEIGLLGMSKMTVPKGAKPGSEIAYAELAIRAVIKPEEGSIAIDGKLTDESYIFSKDCRLTGGFAFYLWASGPHAGDFVLTLGGYHPEFVRPLHYPDVPRLRASWQVTDEVTLTADMYFALTPSCLMAGGKLSVIYQTSCIKAWYVAYANFLLSWKPFYYLVDMGISIGVEAHLRIPLGFCTIGISISVQLSVALHIWGPEFGGVLEVDLSVITLTIRFGPDKAPPLPLKAQEFVESFLPPAPEVIATQINSGLIRQETQKDKKVLRVVNAHALSLTTQSLIPPTEFGELATMAGNPKNATEFGIKPMGRTKLDSTLKVTINGVTLEPNNNLSVSPVDTGVPEALWGKSDKVGEAPLPGSPEAKTIRATAGIRISFKPRDPQGALPAMEIAKFAYENFYKPIPWKDNLSSPNYVGFSDSDGIEKVMGEVTTTNRNAVLEVLRKQSPFELNDVGLGILATTRESYFQDDPEICQLGSLSEGI